MTFEFDQIANQLVTLIKTGKTFFIGTTNGGNIGSLISVQLKNGSSIKAYALSNIKAGQCAVIKDVNTGKYLAIPNATNINQKNVADYKQYKQTRKENIITADTKLKGHVGYVFTKKVTRTTPIICSRPSPSGDPGDVGGGAGDGIQPPSSYVWIRPDSFQSIDMNLEEAFIINSIGFNFLNLSINPDGPYSPLTHYPEVNRGVFIGTFSDYAASNIPGFAPGLENTGPCWFFTLYGVHVRSFATGLRVKSWAVQVGESSTSTDNPTGYQLYDIDYLPVLDYTIIPGEVITPTWELYKPKSGQPPNPGDDPPDVEPGSDDPNNPGSQSYEFYFGGSMYRDPIKLFDLSTNQTFNRDPEIYIKDKTLQLVVFRIGAAGNSGAPNPDGGCRIRVVVIKAGRVSAIRTFRWDVNPLEVQNYIQTYIPKAIFSNYSASYVYPIPSSYIANTTYPNANELNSYFKHSPEKSFYANRCLRNLKKGSDGKYGCVFIDPLNDKPSYDGAATQCLPTLFISDSLYTNSQIRNLKNQDIIVDLRYFRLVLNSSDNSSCFKEIKTNRIKKVKIYNAQQGSIANEDFNILGMGCTFS